MLCLKKNIYYYWNDASIISEACENCSTLKIKGTPSINNIQTIIMGVINNFSEPIYGKELVNELRMTGVKKDKGQKFIIDGSFNLGELLTLTASHSRENHDYHMLEEMLTQQLLF